MAIATFEELRKPKVPSFEELRVKPPEEEPVIFGRRVLVPREPRGLFAEIGQLGNLFSGDMEIEDLLPMEERYQFGKIVGLAPNPDEEKAKLSNSLYYSVQLDMPLKDAYNFQDTLNEFWVGEPTTAQTASQRIKQRWLNGKTQVQMMDLGYDILKQTWRNPEAYIQNLANIQKLQSQLKGDYREDFRGFVERILGATAEQIPIMWEALEEAPVGGTVGIIMGSLIALGGGLLVPAPEEAITVPAGAALGLKVGAGVSAANRIRQLEAGGMFLELMQMTDQYGNSIDPKTAVVVSHAVGAINGGIELLEWKVLLSTFGIGKGLFEKSVGKVTTKLLGEGTLKQIIAKYTLKYGIALSAETLQEIEQETTNIVFGELAKELNNAREGTDFKPISAEDLKARYAEVTAESLRAFGLIVAPGTIISGAIETVVKKPPVEPAKPPEVAVKPPEAPAVAPAAPPVAEVPAEGIKAPVEAITPIEPSVVGKEALLAERKQLYQQISEATKEKRPALEAREEEVIDSLNQIILEEFDPAAGKLPLSWQVKRSEIKVPGSLRTIPKPSEIGGGLRIAVPSARTKGAWQVSIIQVDTTLGKARPITHAEFATKEGALEYLKNIHRNEVLWAVQKGKPVPLDVLEEYKTDKAIIKLARPAEVAKPAPAVKKIPTPKELLGGVPRKPAGLSKAEIEHLGRREQDALRAAQKRGLKVGYKQGVAETVLDARRSLDAFRVKEKISEKMRMDVASIVLTYVPKIKQGDYIRRILQAKTQTRVERLTEAIDTYLDKAEKRQAVRDFKGFVKGIRKKYRRGEVVLGKLPKKLADKLITTLSEFDLAKISEKKTETLEKRAKFVTRISNELADGFEALNEGMDDDATDLLMMGTQRIEELKRLSQTHIGELDTDQIKYIQASWEQLLKINDLKSQAKERIRIEKLRTDINTARQEVTPPKEKVVELTGLLGTVRWIGVEGQSTIRTLVGLSTGKENDVTKRLLVDELGEANNNRKATYQDFIMHFRKLAERAGLKWGDIKNLTETTKVTIDGKEIEVDYNNLLSLYAHTQAEGNLRPLLKTKGLNITVYSRDEHGILNKKHIYRVGKPSLAELRTISELIPKEHKKLLDIYFKTNWAKQAPAINETSMAIQNYELARKEKYFHLNREIERVIEGRKADISVSIEQQGRYLPRTGGNARINIRPFTLEVMKGMQADAAYHDMAIPMENARTLVANSKWREAMKRAGQQKALSEITRMLRRTQGLISDQSIIELTASRFLGTVGKSILSVRLSGSLVQTASVPAAIEFIDAKYLTQIDVPTPALIKHLKEIDPVLWMRWEGKQFDYALGMVGSQNAFEVLLFDHRPMTEQFLFPYTAGDEVAITKLFMAAERKIEAETKLKRGTDEFQKASLDLLHEAMTTQPQWDMLHRSPLTSDPSVLARSVTMFMSARNAQYNVLVRAIDDYRKGRIDKGILSERLAGVGMANMLVSLSRHLFKELALAGAVAFFVALGLREPPDKEEIKDEAIRIAKKVPIETAFNLVGLNAFGGIFVSMGYRALQIQKYGWAMGRYSDIRTGNMMADITLDVMQTGVDFILFTQQLISGEKYKSGKNRGRYKWEITGTRLIDEAVTLIAYRFGLPYEGPKSDIIWPAQRALKKAKTKQVVSKIER